MALLELHAKTLSDQKCQYLDVCLHFMYFDVAASKGVMSGCRPNYEIWKCQMLSNSYQSCATLCYVWKFHFSWCVKSWISRGKNKEQNCSDKTLNLFEITVVFTLTFLNVLAPMAFLCWWVVTRPQWYLSIPMLVTSNSDYSISFDVVFSININTNRNVALDCFPWEYDLGITKSVVYCSLRLGA